MKRWEESWRDESWEAIRYKVHLKREDGHQGTEVGSFLSDAADGTEDAYSDRGRAALAAQAPAMARLLLEMWEESQERNGPQYPLAIGDVLRAAGVVE